MPEIFVGIGSNVEPERNICSAMAELRAQFGRLRVSGIYESEAVGGFAPPFLNLVASAETPLSPGAVRNVLRAIETAHGRVRTPETRLTPALDLDLLLYGDTVLTDGPIRLPHPDVLRRAHVLEPLAELTPDGRHPVNAERYADLWTRFDKTGMNQRRLGPAPF